MRTIKLLRASGAGGCRSIGVWLAALLALDAGTNDLRKIRQRYARDDDPEHQIIDIEAARRQGILSITHDAVPAPVATTASGH